MSETTNSKKVGCLSIIGFIILVGVLISIFKGDAYDVIKDENGIITAEAEIDYDEHYDAAYEIAEIVWKISKEFQDAEKITIKIKLNGKNSYGKSISDELNPYVLDRHDIVETNKYEFDNYKFLMGREFASAYLMQNGYYPSGM